MRLFILLNLCLLITIPVSSQLLKGSIVNSKGNPIPLATVYIQEITLGIVCDDHGEFQTMLENGLYTATISSLGHEKKVIPVTIADQDVTLRIELAEKTYGIGEITVRPGGEDPAYPIMRNAIAMAPLYLNQIKNYQADVYLKGTVKIHKLPALVKLQVGSQNIKDLTDKLFLVESQNEVTFSAPNKYDQRVVALSSTLPIELDDDMAMGVATSSIYSSDIFGGVSPLAANAFSYYRFQLEDISSEGDYLINKIKIIPKKDNSKLVKGYIYIVENLWNVHHADLTMTETGVTFRNNIAYHEIRPGAFLPTAYDMSMHVDMMGAKIDGKYYSSIQYKEIQVNESLAINPSKELQKEAIILSKQIVKEQKKLKNKELEIKPRDSTFRISRDTLALLRDTSYWQHVRHLPLRPEEILSYQIKDSLKAVSDSVSKADSLQNRSFKTWAGHVLTGERIHLNNKFSLKYGGLMNACPEYNFVDGFWLGQKLNVDFNLPRKRSLSITPSMYYLTARKDINWQIEGVYYYNRIRRGELTFTAAHISADFAGEYGTNRLVNSLASLLFAENTIKFYDKKNFSLSNQLDLVHALQLTTFADYEKRQSLSNQTSFHFWGGSPAPNIPNSTFHPMPKHASFRMGAKLQYTPRQFYRMWKDEKQYLHSNYPTFWVSYLRAIPFEGSDASFEKIEAGLHQSVRLNLFNKLNYSVQAGMFTAAKTMYLPDFRHFSTNELIVTTHALGKSFSLLNNYQYSTNNRWLQGHIELASNYLLFKNVRFMQRYLFDESLHINTLWVPGKNHTEAGYSLGIGDIGRVGVFAGFENGKYNGVGCMISIPFVQFLSGRNPAPVISIE